MNDPYEIENYDNMSPEREIQRISQYQFKVKLIQTPLLRKFSEVNAYFKNPSASPVSCDNEFDLDEENDGTFNTIILGEDKNTGTNLIQSDLNIRSKSVDQRAPQPGTFYYKSTQNIRIPRASIFKKQYLQEKRMQNLRVNLMQSNK